MLSQINLSSLTRGLRTSNLNNFPVAPATDSVFHVAIKAARLNAPNCIRSAPLSERRWDYEPGLFLEQPVYTVNRTDSGRARRDVAECG